MIQEEKLKKIICGSYVSSLREFKSCRKHACVDFEDPKRGKQQKTIKNSQLVNIMSKSVLTL